MLGAGVKETSSKRQPGAWKEVEHSPRGHSKEHSIQREQPVQRACWREEEPHVFQKCLALPMAGRGTETEKTRANRMGRGYDMLGPETRLRN